MAYILEDSYHKITQKFDQNLDQTLIVEIYSEHEALLKALGFPDGPKWLDVFGLEAFEMRKVWVDFMGVRYAEKTTG